MHYSTILIHIAPFIATVHSAAFINPRGVAPGRNPYPIFSPDTSSSPSTPPGNPISWCGGPNTQSNLNGPQPQTCNPYKTYTLGRDSSIPQNTYTWGDCLNPSPGNTAHQWYRITSFPTGATSCTLYFDQACMGWPYAGLTVLASSAPLDLTTVGIPGLGNLSFMSKVGSFSCVKGGSTGQAGVNNGENGQSGNTGSSDGTGSTGSTGGNGVDGEVGQGGNTGACNAAGQCSGNTPGNGGRKSTGPRPRGS